MEYICDIDYLTVVFPHGSNLLPLPATEPYMQWVKRSGLIGYDRGQVDRVTGLIRLVSTTRQDMGTCYVASAKTLCALAEIQGSASYLFGALSTGFSIAYATRLDVRADVIDSGASIYELVKSVLNRTVKCKAKKIKHYLDPYGKDGCTVYFGSGKSNSYVRCYDKFAESNGTKPYSRIEVQLRGKYAKRAWDELIAANTEDKASIVIKSIIRSRISRFGVPDLDAIIDDSVPLSFHQDDFSQSDTIRWLKTQVLPTFVRDGIAHNGDTPLLKWFVALVRERLNPS